jgi:N2-acetyl-L-2,4-diaminobutanoate deacetylase
VIFMLAPDSSRPIVDYNDDCLQSRRLAETPVSCTLDLDAPGKHVGRLELPRSTNTSGWSHLFIPIVSINGGDGPTALVLGGVHGDEPEGQVAALNLARETRPEDVSGQLIVVPCLSPEASRASTRLWPSGANLNRSFPGSPDGPPDEQLADFVSRCLIARADIVVDMHSGGRSALCPPWSEMHWVDDPEQRRRMLDGMLAWNTDVHFVYIDIAGTGLLTGDAERQGKIVVSTELGGGGHVTAATHRVALGGLKNVLRHFGLLAGQVETRESLGLPPAVIVRATEAENYLLAPDSGLWETLVDVGDRVEAGQAVGRIHFLERPEREPETVFASNGGFVCVVRAIATTEQGDNVVVVGREIDVAELA